MAPAFDTYSRDPDDVARVFRYFAEVETPRLGSRVYTDYCAGSFPYSFFGAAAYYVSGRGDIDCDGYVLDGPRNGDRGF